MAFDDLWSDGIWSMPSPISNMLKDGPANGASAGASPVRRGMPRVGSAGRLTGLDDYPAAGIPRTGSYERMEHLGSMTRDRSYDRLDRAYDQMRSDRMMRERSFDKLQAAADHRLAAGNGERNSRMPRTMSNEHLNRIAEEEVRMPRTLSGEHLQRYGMRPEGVDEDSAGMRRVGSSGSLRDYMEERMSIKDRYHMPRSSSNNSLTGLMERPRLTGSRGPSRNSSYNNLTNLESTTEDADAEFLLGDTVFVF